MLNVFLNIIKFKLPETMWSEDYHVTLLQEHFNTFDSLIANGIPILGEMIWNFADFKTPQGKKPSIKCLFLY